MPIATARKDWGMSKFGVSSSVANLKRVAVRPPTRDADYQAAHWLGAPEQLDLDALQADHAAFVELLRELGCEVDVLPEAPGQPDACFVYDPAFTTPTGVIQLQGAKEARVKEPAMLAGDINALGMPTVGIPSALMSPASIAGSFTRASFAPCNWITPVGVVNAGS